MGELPTGTVTFLFTDIEGSTRLLDEHGAAYAGLLEEHRRVLREAFARHAGVEVDTQGDAFFVAFARASDAVAAAEEAQTRLQLPVRMSIHTGEPQLTAEGYVGMDVHRAARICAAGHGGQVVVSESTQRLLQDRSLRDLGEHRLKDFDEPSRLYQVGHEAFPPLRTISNTNLPRPASSFVGRQREVREVVGRLESGVRLLTLTGPGGTGKTRLALEAAAELVPEFKGGVLWVGLAPLRDPALVVEAVSETLGARNGVAEHIGDRELLLLLDNFEQVVAAAPELASLLERCPNLTILVTSRELLRVRGEVEYGVLPLAQPEAVRLFCARAGLEADEAVDELCRRLDNLPLALELAAARTTVLSPQQILERISQRLDLLKGRRDVEARQLTLRAAIEWSHELLTEHEQRLFADLTVFAGGCTLEAAENVVRADVDTLQSLVDKSLVRRTGERFWMLETIREFGLERLEATGSGAELRQRLAEWMLQLAQEAKPHLVASDQVEWLERIDAERDNVRVVLDGALAACEPQVALELAADLCRFWWVRAPSEGLAWIERGLSAGEVPPAVTAAALDAAGGSAWFLGDAERALQLFEQGLAIYEELGDRQGIGVMLNRLGPPLAALGRAEESDRVVGEAAAIHRHLGNKQELALSLELLGTHAFEKGDVQKATQLLEESVALARESGDLHMLTYAVANLAEATFVGGDLEAATRYAIEHLALASEIGDNVSLIFGLAVRAIVVMASGDEERAGALWGAAERLDVELGETMWRRERHKYEELLGDRGPRFGQGVSEGAKLSLERAVQLGLEP